MHFERFATRGHQLRLSSRAIALFAVSCIALTTALPAAAATLDRIRETGRIKFGYLVDARPFSFQNAAGDPEGYGVRLCQGVAVRVKAQLSLSDLAVDWVPVSIENRMQQIQDGSIDLLCTPASVTSEHRQNVSFSIPVFPGGNRAVLRADASTELRDTLSGASGTRPVWRGSPATKVLQGTSIAVVTGTSTQKWLEKRRAELQIDAKIVPVPDYRTALQQLADHKVDVVFGDRAVVLGAMDESQHKNLVVLDRLYTYEYLAFPLARGDEDFRLSVDSALSELYASDEFRPLYEKWGGAFNENTRKFFQWNTLPQ